MHAATRLHYDLRLEMEGVLRSWAVPKGPSYDTADKRLAVHVEDHPIEYGDFEGLIPKGNYGAGAVIVWDRGEWVPIGDPLEGLEKGKLLFELRGYKLHGLWTLVKIKKGEKEWLLIKERDEWASTERVPPARSRCSRGSRSRTSARAAIAGEAIRQRARRGSARRAGRSRPKTASLDAGRDRRAGVLAGGLAVRAQARRLSRSGARGEAARPRLLTRNGNDYSDAFPEVARAVAALPFDRVLLDGEVVALDEQGLPSFQRLQGRARLRRPIDIRHAAVECPVTYYAFDLLGFEDFDLRPLPLTTRKALLQRVLPPVGALRYLEHVEDDGEALYREAERLGLEGIVAKKATAPYKAGRSPVWLKVRSRKTADFVVVGFTAPKGSRGGFGALHLAEYVDGVLTYTGRVGTGFTDKQLAEVSRTLQAHRRADAALRGVRCRRRRGRPGSSRCSCARSSTPSGRRRGCCGSRCSCGSATTSGRKSAFGKAIGGSGRREVEAPASEGENGERRAIVPAARPAVARRRDATSSRSSSPTSRRSSGPTTATPRAIWSSTTAPIVALAAALPAGPAAGDDAVSRRDRRQVLLPEGRARVRAGLDPHRADVERGYPAGDRLLRLRRRGRRCST